MIVTLPSSLNLAKVENENLLSSHKTLIWMDFMCVIFAAVVVVVVVAVAVAVDNGVVALTLDVAAGVAKVVVVIAG